MNIDIIYKAAIRAIRAPTPYPTAEAVTPLAELPVGTVTGPEVVAAPEPVPVFLAVDWTLVVAETFPEAPPVVTDAEATPLPAPSDGERPLPAETRPVAAALDADDTTLGTDETDEADEADEAGEEPVVGTETGVGVELVELAAVEEGELLELEDTAEQLRS